MKRTVLALLFILFAQASSAQIPVFDAANLAQAIATVVELQAQVRLLTKNLRLTGEIERGTQQIDRTTRSHLDRYRRSLQKRGVVPSTPLGALLRAVEAELKSPVAISYLGGDANEVWLGHTLPDDPIAYEQYVVRRGLGTMEHSILALGEHSRQMSESHSELERFKREIASNLEPQQMRDVQASLQVLDTRESLLLRQAVIMLANLEAVQAASELDRRAQEKVLYSTFVGSANWLGDPAAYRVESFLRMPGKQGH